MIKNNLSWKVIIPNITGVIGFVVWIVGWILAFTSDFKDDSLLVIGTVIMSIGTFMPVIYFIISLAIAAIKNKSIWSKIVGISTITGIILIGIGATILFFGISIDNRYNVDEVEVIEVNDNSITIDYSRYNYADYKTKVIKKPFFIKIEKGDVVNVRYPTSEPEKMYYVINHEVGIIILVIGILLAMLWFISLIVLLPFRIIKEISNKKKEIKQR